MKTMNGEAHEGIVKRPPTDLELMLYVDGELEGERQREVRQAIQRDSVLRRKVAALSLSSDIVRENATSSAASFDIADAIMAKVADDKDASRDARDAAPGSASVKVAEVKPLLRPGLGKATKGGASNDNARGIFALAAIAVAAAAGLMVWGRMDTSAPRATESAVAMVTTPEAVPAPAPEPQPAAPSVANAEDGEDVGVEVAAVDFGSRIGTIFYVPTEAATSNHTTTVVWLADDPVGGEQ